MLHGILCLESQIKIQLIILVISKGSGHSYSRAIVLMMHVRCKYIRFILGGNDNDRYQAFNGYLVVLLIQKIRIMVILPYI